MGRQGLSMAQKREIMFKLLQDLAVPCGLKELEKKGSKKGVTTMSIKDVLTELVDDNLINLDKIGSSNFYWAFKSETNQKRLKKLKELKEEKMNAEKKLAEFAEKKKQLESERIVCPERTEKLRIFRDTQQKVSKLETELKYKQQNDPRKVQKLMDKVKYAKAGADRWTDNVWAMGDHLKKKYHMDKREIRKVLCITDDFDYPEFQHKKKKQKK